MKGGHKVDVIRASVQNFSSLLSFKTEVSGKMDSGVGESGIVSSQFFFILVRKDTVLRNSSPLWWRERDLQISLRWFMACPGIGGCGSWTVLA